LPSAILGLAVAGLRPGRCCVGLCSLPVASLPPYRSTPSPATSQPLVTAPGDCSAPLPCCTAAPQPLLARAVPPPASRVGSAAAVPSLRRRIRNSPSLYISVPLLAGPVAVPPPVSASSFSDLWHCARTFLCPPHCVARGSVEPSPAHLVSLSPLSAIPAGPFIVSAEGDHHRPIHHSPCFATMSSGCPTPPCLDSCLDERQFWSVAATVLLRLWPAWGKNPSP
jgi:hypothetical protein